MARYNKKIETEKDKENERKGDSNIEIGKLVNKGIYWHRISFVFSPIPLECILFQVLRLEFTSLFIFTLGK